jgi:cobalt-zinc-cadmium resistance protein CzcA
MRIVYDYKALARYDVNLSEVNYIIEAALVGKEVGDYFEYDWKFPIIVRIEEDIQRTSAQIERIPIPLKSGGTIPLGYVAKIKEEEKVTSIARSNSFRYAGLAINLKDRDVQSFVREARQKLNLKTLGLSSDFDISWEGQYKNLEKAQLRLAVIIPMILGLIFYLLYLAFHSIKQVIIVFSGIPFALSGGILALHIAGINFSISAAVGFIALMGIAILNGLVLINFINELIAKGEKITAALFQAIEIRLRPVLMTALVASLGFLPMAINTSIGAEVQRPLAIVVIGGVFTSTILTILILPVLFALFYKDEK